MVRLVGVRERRDKTWYDTHCIEPGQDSPKFFGNKNIGDKFKTNMRVPGQMENSNTFMTFVLGARLIGKTREQEDLLFDHLHVQFVVGDKLRYDSLGPQLSMLRHVFLRSELKRLKKETKAFNNESEWTKTGRSDWEPPRIRFGYHFARPVVIPVRQSFCVNVSASEQLPEAVNMRVHLFGAETRDVP